MLTEEYLVLIIILINIQNNSFEKKETMNI